MNNRLWRRTAALGGFAVAALAFALHTRMTWVYFRPDAAQLAALLPLPGPLFLSVWSGHLLRLGAAALFFLSLPGLGRLCLPRGRAFPPFAAAGMGLLVWSTAGFLLAAAGLCSPTVLRAASLLLAALGLRFFPFRPAEMKEAARALREPLPLALLSFAAFYLLTTVVPDTFYDALVYHLAAPEAWLKAGRMTDMPDVHLWRLPGLMQPLYLWALAWSDDRLCKLLTLGIGFLAAGHLGLWAAARWGRPAGLWAALLFLSAPMMGVNLWSCANDVPAGFFAFLSLALWLDGWEEKTDGPLLLLSGIFFGAAVAAKGTALFAAPYFFFDALRRRRGAPVALGLFGAGALLPLLPWWTRAGLWTGNPFFPNAAALLGGDTPENLALLKIWRADAAGEGGLFFRALSLVRESLRGVETGRFGFLGPALLMLLPLAFFFRPGALPGALAAYALTAYVLFVSSTGRLRYFIPHLPPLFALAALGLADYGAATAADRIGKNLGRALKALVAAAVGLNLFWMALVFHRFNQGWPVVWGRQSAAGYLREEHIGVYGHPSQGAFDWLRDNGAAGRLFLLGEARTYRAPIPASASGRFNAPRYALLAGDPPSAETLLARLRAEGFTHLLVNVEELKRLTLAAYKTPAHLRAMGTLLDGLPPPLYRDRWCILFRLP